MATTTDHHPAWQQAAGRARTLAWISLGWMTAEGVLGLTAGIDAHSIALIAWALGSVIEGLASVIVIWRFTGSRTLSETSERTAQRAVAVSFWLLAPYIAIEAIRDLAAHQRPGISTLGIAVTAASIVIMPGLGVAKHQLGKRLHSEATAAEGTQNFMCAAQGAAVLAVLGANRLWAAWWLDAPIAIALALWAIREGREAWQGEDCC